MANLHIFNPEHDLVLAAAKDNFTPPAAAVKLRQGLGFIPAFWADNGDTVIVDDDMRDKLDLCPYQQWMADVRWMSWSELRHMTRKERLSAFQIQPWGWDAALCRSLQKAGIDVSQCMNAQRLEVIRRLSGRATAVEVLNDIKKDLALTVGEAAVVHQTEEIQQRRIEWGSVVLKSPWSCSGRGVKVIPSPLTPHASPLTSHPSPLTPIENWAQRVLNHQGYLTVEQYLDKAIDFGMEFDAREDGLVVYRGLSLFCAERGAYSGNIIASDQHILTLLTQYVEERQVSDIKAWLCCRLSSLLQGHYTGPLGVDMMVVRKDDGFAINPCVEINLRRTMGHLAIDLYQKIKATRRFSIANYQLLIIK